MRYIYEGAAILVAITLLAGCAPSEQERLSKKWECGQTLLLSFDRDGTYAITSTATNPPGVWTGKYSVANNRISVTGPTAHPLNRYTNIQVIGPQDLVLSANAADILVCSLKR